VLSKTYAWLEAALGARGRMRRFSAGTTEGLGSLGTRRGRELTVEAKSKRDLAVAFINSIRAMDPSVLNALIVREAGEDLAQFFLNYAANLISKDPQRVLENTSSLMLMGYLIRTYEENKEDEPKQNVFQTYALA
jgi:hypothetical protein